MRGIHPVILEDRGSTQHCLRSSLAPVPVTLDVHVAQRPSAAVESAAIVVNEALTNAAKHATRRATSIAPANLVVEVRDNGQGRRRPTSGPLQGLRDCRWPAVRCVISPVGADNGVGRAAMRIVIAEDSVLLRAGLTRILADAGEDVAATVGDADELLVAVERHKPDLCVVDVRMPTHTDDGLRAAIAIQAWGDRHPRAVAVCRGALRHRAARRSDEGIGYLLKAWPCRRVRRRCTSVANKALDPEVVSQLLARSCAAIR